MWFIALVVYIGITGTKAEILPLPKGTYGPYKLQVINATTCAVPKGRNLTMTNFSIRQVDNQTLITFNVTVLTKNTMNKAKLVISRVYDKDAKGAGSYSSILYPKTTYNIDKPCQHFLTGPVIKLFINNTSCTVYPGSYVAEMNIDSIMGLLVHTAVYGRYFNRLTITSKQGAAACFAIDNYVLPKD